MSYAFSKPLFGRCVAALVFCEKLLTEPGRTCLTISGNVSVLFWDHPSLANMSNLMDRITPAHAGKSVFHAVLGVQPWDHPRTRGEKMSEIGSGSRSEGSPPHTRGKGCQIFFRQRDCGITPAHAGKSSRHKPHNAVTWDHPRTRGEKRHRRSIRARTRGSPPHTRGKEIRGQSPVS